MRSQYHKIIKERMNNLALLPNSIFIGQQVMAPENFYGTLVDVPIEKRLELPVCEELQLGLSLGLSLKGYFPISIIQRCDFLPRCLDQIVNHLNLMEECSRKRYVPRILLRTTIGSKVPLNVGPQHSQNLVELMKIACKFPVFLVETVKEVNEAYDFAIKSTKSTLIIERQALYETI
jgi:pyruvate/2-oxoglutarate/acetoin dehydrogenase E1 component